MARRWRGSPSRKETRFQDLSKRDRAAYLHAHALMYARPDKLAAAIERHPAPPPKQERIRRPVDNKPAYRSEHQEQADIVSWWNLACTNYALPPIALFAIPNGGARDVITGARLKAEGVRPGVFDFCLAVPRKGFHGLYIEMKVGNNRPTDNQLKFQSYLTSAGYETGIYWNSGAAIDAIKAYLE